MVFAFVKLSRSQEIVNHVVATWTVCASDRLHRYFTGAQQRILHELLRYDGDDPALTA